jgi:hypothetical protein
MNFITRFSLLSATLLSVTIFPAHAATPALECTLTDTVAKDGSPGEEQDTFAPNTALIYMVCDVDNLKKGQELKSVWIADNTNKVAPDNYTIDQSKYLVPKNPDNNETLKAKFSITKPDKGWPKGNYHVDIYVDNKLSETANYTVK